MSDAMSALGRDPDGYGFAATQPTDPHQLGLHRHLLVSERLRLRRRQLGLTQKEVVARLRRLGVDTTNKALSSLEHGAGLDVCKLPELARALDCTLTYLVGLSSDPLRWEPDGDGWPRVAAGPTQPAVLARTALSVAAPAARDVGVVGEVDEQPEPSEGPWILGPTGVRSHR